MHTFFMTPNAARAPSQSTQTGYLIKFGSSSEKRPTSYLIKCHIMRYHSLRHKGLQSYSQACLQLLLGVAVSQSTFSFLFRTKRGALQTEEMLTIVNKVSRCPFFEWIKQKPSSFSPSEGSSHM